MSNGMDMFLAVTPRDVATVLSCWRETCARPRTAAQIKRELDERRVPLEGQLSAIATYRFPGLAQQHPSNPLIVALGATRDSQQCCEPPWILDATADLEEAIQSVAPYVQQRDASVRFLSPQVGAVHPGTRFAETVTGRALFVARATAYLVLSGALVHDAATAGRFWADLLDGPTLMRHELCAVLAHSRIAPAWAHLASDTLSRLLTHPEAGVRALAITRMGSAEPPKVERGRSTR